ncbi:nucleoside deaminase [Oecophyllibacter saccharovorans]|uniref:nucleoside deaminase n=1 Tax=Oecophyllibacter saccharovorans TaxID=2558360 RepID=UPI00116C36D3|nr:nucleoside deaminase [Oecophyllibacter saccharovorans]TPW35379.1 nucleoside deaminase [Oecophyllibacter saccharovorans]
MAMALEEAAQAARCGEVPVGAVVLDAEGRLLARAANRVEHDLDASAHAEVLALRRAARKFGSARLEGCTLVVTLEPCAMCAAALGHFRIRRLVYGAYDPKGGGVDHGAQLFRQPGCLHRPQEIISGMNERESGALLQAFFRGLRSLPLAENRRNP